MSKGRESGPFFLAQALLYSDDDDSSRPLAILLTTVATIALMASIVVVAYAVGAAAETDFDVSIALGYVALLPIILLLVRAAYPPERRRWWHWLVSPPLWFLFAIAAAIWLPWLASTKRHWRAVRADTD